MASRGGRRYGLRAARGRNSSPCDARETAPGKGAVITELVIKLPAFDTGQYEGCEFNMSGDAQLRLVFSELPEIRINFSRVRWHQFTALPNCTVEMIEGAYFRLVELRDSSALAAFIAADQTPRKAYRELHHYRIFLDETGCHELFAQSAHRAT